MSSDEQQEVSPKMRKKSVNRGGIVTIHGYNIFKCFMRKVMTYIELSNDALDIYESEKMWRKKKSPKITIQLSHVFNVSNHWDPKLKECINITTPDDIYLIKFDNDNEINEWLDELKDRILAARACEFQRPFFSEQFFEAVWEGVIVENPKVKRKMTKYDKVPNICAKSTELNNRVIRLCYYPHSVIVCNRGIIPIAEDLPESEFPPFPKSQFIEIEKIYLSNYGSQENYVILRMGRSSTYGCCEIWIKMESTMIAQNAHNKLSTIIERQKEKRNFILHGSPNSEMEKNYQMLTKNENYAADEEAEHRARFDSFDGNIEMYSAYQKLRRNKIREEGHNNNSNYQLNTIVSNSGTDKLKNVTGCNENISDVIKSPTENERKFSGLRMFNPLSLIKDRTFSIKSKSNNKNKSKDDSNNVDSSNKKTIPSNDDYQPPLPFNTWQTQISQISQKSMKMFDDTETEDSGGTLKFVEQDEILSTKSGETINQDSIINNNVDNNKNGRKIDYDYASMNPTIIDTSNNIIKEEDEKDDECRCNENPSPGECYNNGIQTDSSMSCQSSICSVLEHDDEEVLSHLSSVSSKRPNDFLHTTNDDLRSALGRRIYFDSENEYTHMESNPSYNSPTHLSVPNSFDHHEEHKNFNYDSSDSCYSSIQATNSGRSHGTRTDSFSTNIHSRTSTMSSSASGYCSKHPTFHPALNNRKNTIHGGGCFSNRNKQVSAILESDSVSGESCDNDLTSEARKRAFSLGSKNLLNSKFCNKNNNNPLNTKKTSTLGSQNSPRNLTSNFLENYHGKGLLPIKNSQSSGDVQSNVKINTSTNSLKSNRSGSINSTTSSVSSKTAGVVEQKDNEYFMEMDFRGFLTGGFLGGLGDNFYRSPNSPIDSCSHSRTPSNTMRDRKASNGSKGSTGTSIDGKTRTRKTSTVKPTPFNGSTKSVNKIKKFDFDNITSAMQEVKCFIDSPTPVNGTTPITKKTTSNDSKKEGNTKKVQRKTSTISSSGTIIENNHKERKVSIHNQQKIIVKSIINDSPTITQAQNPIKSQGDYILCAPAPN
uniref:PH domain-containing protein n=1 Tax=Parastrongyloides trichosuri TaxID=131310 RepID=A0A0N4ZEF9_PARTI